MPAKRSNASHPATLAEAFGISAAAWQRLTVPKSWRIMSPLLPPECRTVKDAKRIAWTRANMHSHSYRQIMICLRGTAPYGMDGVVYDCRPGTVFFFERFSPHDDGYPRVTPDADHLWVPVVRERVSARLVTVRKGRVTHPEEARLLVHQRELGIDLETVWPTPEVAAGLPQEVIRARLVAGTAMLLAGVRERLMREPDARAELTFQEGIIQTVREHLHETAGRGDSVEALARLAGYSTYHFLRLFKKHTGYTVHAYIDQCRLTRMQELERKGMTRAQIAHALGFTAPSSFSRWVRQLTKRR